LDNTIFSLLFLATAPIMLMPSAIALFARKKHASVILAVNLLVWGGLYLLMREGLATGSRSGLALPVPVALITWLILLRFALVNDRESP
jgi:hypothetical protein